MGKEGLCSGEEVRSVLSKFPLNDVVLVARMMDVG
jgi:hypothetical protein